MTIQLDNNWTIASDTYSWVLTFSEMREKKKLDKNRKETGEVEPYEHIEPWYYPRISDCLKKFKEEALKTTETVEELLLKLDSIDKKIGEIKNDVFKK